MDDLKSEFWDRMEDVRTAMLGIEGKGRLVAMSPTTDDDYPGKIWFITAKDTDLSKAAGTGAPGTFIVCSTDGQLHTRIEGTLSQTNDRAELDRLWNKIAEAWFEGGKDDPDVQLLRFDLKEAEVWLTGGGLKFLYEVAKANLTDSKPDIGDHAVLRF